MNLRRVDLQAAARQKETKRTKPVHVWLLPQKDLIGLKRRRWRQPAFLSTSLEEVLIQAGWDSWLALYVRPRSEKSVKRFLDYKGYRTSLPLAKCYHTRRSGSDWVSEKPLISGYVFAALDPENRFQIVTTPGVIQIVGLKTGSGAIPAFEIEALERVAESRLPVAQCEYTRIGEAVSLIRGPLKGLQGILMRESSATRLVVSVEMLHRSVSVEIDNTWAVPLQRHVA